MGLNPAAWLRRVLGRGAPAAEPAGPTARPVPRARELDRQGVEWLDAGRLGEAVEAFRQAVRLEPDAVALRVNLAYALQESGEEEEATVHLRRAVELDPMHFDALYMLGGALERAGRFDESARRLRSAVELRPGFEPARGQLCRVLAQAGDPAGARAEIDRGLALHPASAQLHHYLGKLLLGAGDADGALPSLRRAVDLAPGDPEMLGDLALALHARGDHEAALDGFDQALAIAPSLVGLRLSQAASLQALGRRHEACAALRAFVEVEPGHADATNNLGRLLQELGQLDEAIACFRRVTELAPDQPAGYCNLGLALEDRGDIDEAILSHRRGLDIGRRVTLHGGLASALKRQGRVEEAIAQYRLALELDPGNASVRCNLSLALAEGQGTQAVLAALRELLAAEPDHPVAHHNLLFNLSFDETTSPEDYIAEARRFDAKLTRTPLPHAPADPAAGVSRPLRVGFVSGDLRGHAVGFFVEGIVGHLDPRRVSLHAYNTGAVEDEHSARMRAHFAVWRSVRGLRHEAAAQAIRADGIDILVDLAGHTALNGLPIFAYRPAALQVSWLGYLASTGLRTMDYLLADRASVPEGCEHHFAERVWCLPHSLNCFSPPADAPPVAPLPALSGGGLTFGSFQRINKISDTTLRTWAKVLAQVPRARLRLQNPQLQDPGLRERLVGRLRAAGLPLDRVDLEGPVKARGDYLRGYEKVDIVLDTFPYPGITTTCEALWMGVPSVTLTGSTLLARQGLALLRAAGMEDWVAASREEYVAIAVARAADLPALVALRAGLRERVRYTPLFDVPMFARHLEEAFLGMWRARREELERSPLAPDAVSPGARR